MSTPAVISGKGEPAKSVLVVEPAVRNHPAFGAALLAEARALAALSLNTTSLAASTTTTTSASNSPVGDISWSALPFAPWSPSEDLVRKVMGSIERPSAELVDPDPQQPELNDPPFCTCLTCSRQRFPIHLLPPELLSLILHHASIPLSTPASHSNLCRYSLVSKTWREPAQRLLWRVVKITNSAHAKRIARSSVVGKFPTVSLVFDGAAMDEYRGWTMLAEKSLRGVQKLRIVDSHLVSFLVLSQPGLENLTTLELHNVRLWPQNTYPVFPFRLHHLFLGRLKGSPSFYDLHELATSCCQTLHLTIKSHLYSQPVLNDYTSDHPLTVLVLLLAAKIHTLELESSFDISSQIVDQFQNMTILIVPDLRVVMGIVGRKDVVLSSLYQIIILREPGFSHCPSLPRKLLRTFTKLLSRPPYLSTLKSILFSGSFDKAFSSSSKVTFMTYRPFKPIAGSSTIEVDTREEGFRYVKALEVWAVFLETCKKRGVEVWRARHVEVLKAARKKE